MPCLLFAGSDVRVFSNAGNRTRAASCKID
jgi:hypothetical protein